MTRKTLRGRYNDGETTKVHRVGLAIEGTDLVISGAGTQVRWRLAEIHLVETETGLLRLRCGFEHDDRLTLEAGDDGAWLIPECPNIRRTTPGWRRHGKPMLLWGGAAAVSVLLLVTVIIPLFSQQVANALPEAIERRLGEAVRVQVLGLLARLENKAGGADMVCGGGAAALRLTTERLAGHLDRPPRVRVSAVDSKIKNAMALPGGHVLIFRGLLEFARNGDEIAGVLAHEIAHVAKRHPLAIAIERANMFLLFGLLIGDVAGGTVIAGLGQVLLGAAYSRAAEREADATAIEILNKAGIRGGPLADLLVRAEERDKIPELISSHPGAKERAEVIRRLARGLESAFTDADWQALRRACG